MSKINNCWVFAEQAASLADVLSGALTLADEVAAVVIGGQDDADKALHAGASKVYFIDAQEDAIAEDYTATWQSLVAQEKPRLVILKQSKRTRLLAGRLAAALQTSVITDVTNLVIEGDAVIGEHLVYGGSALRRAKNTAGTCIALVGEGVFTAGTPGVTGGVTITVPYVPPARRAQVLERKPKTGESVNLAIAKKVVGIGRGVQKQEDIAIVEALAKALGAEIACTRPIAEGENWLARERYIGVSGAMLKPDYYLAVGISGQIQHMVGVNNARTIIAINSDKNAPIFKLADYGLVADLYTAVPKLTAALASL
jgi:electron transfer flavoprotein alpha subunit